MKRARAVANGVLTILVLGSARMPSAGQAVTGSGTVKAPGGGKGPGHGAASKPGTGKAASVKAPGTGPAAKPPVAVAAPAPPALDVPVPAVNYPLSAITAVTFSADGRFLAVGAYSQTVVYDTSTWQPVSTFRRVLDSARSLAFMPSGKLLAVGSGLTGRNGQAVLWDGGPDGAGRTLIGQKDAVEAIAFSKDGKQILLGSDDNTVRWYPDSASFQYINLDEHNGRVQAVAFSPKNNWIFVTGAADHLVKVWDPRTRRTVINFDQCESAVTGLAFLNNGDQFVGSSLDGKVYWWGVGYDKKHDTFGGYLFRVESAHPDGVYALSMCGDGSRFITCGADDTVGVWNSGGGRIRTFKEADQPLYSVALSPDGKIAAGGGRAGLLYIWDVEASKLTHLVAPPPLAGAASAKAAAVGQTVH